MYGCVSSGDKLAPLDTQPYMTLQIEPPRKMLRCTREDFW
jgi:hypothetical protein